jgi:hypothetical protein
MPFNSYVLGQANISNSTNTAGAVTSVNQKNASTAINITGSIPLKSTINTAIFSRIKTTLSDAVLTAQKTVGSNSSAASAFLRLLNGYMVYDIHVRNNANNTSYAVIIDPGNGKVLYKQTLPSISSSAATGGHRFMSGRGGGFATFGAADLMNSGNHFAGSHMSTTNSGILNNNIQGIRA